MASVVRAPTAPAAARRAATAAASARRGSARPAVVPTIPGFAAAAARSRSSTASDGSRILTYGLSSASDASSGGAKAMFAHQSFESAVTSRQGTRAATVPAPPRAGDGPYGTDITNTSAGGPRRWALGRSNAMPSSRSYTAGARAGGGARGVGGAATARAPSPRLRSAATPTPAARSAALDLEVRLNELEHLTRMPGSPPVVEEQALGVLQLMEDVAEVAGSLGPVLMSMRKLVRRCIISDSEYMSVPGGGDVELSGGALAKLPYFVAVARLREEREVMLRRRYDMQAQLDAQQEELEKMQQRVDRAFEARDRAMLGHHNAENESKELGKQLEVLRGKRGEDKEDASSHVVSLHRELAGLKRVYERDHQEMLKLRAFRDRVEGMRKLFVDMENTRRAVEGRVVLNDTYGDGDDGGQERGVPAALRFGSKRGLGKVADLSTITEADVRPVPYSASLADAVSNSMALERELLTLLNARLDEFEASVEGLQPSATTRVRRIFVAESREMVAEAERLREHIEHMRSLPEWHAAQVRLPAEPPPQPMPRGSLWTMFRHRKGTVPRAPRTMSKAALLKTLYAVFDSKLAFEMAQQHKMEEAAKPTELEATVHGAPALSALRAAFARPAAAGAAGAKSGAASGAGRASAGGRSGASGSESDGGVGMAGRDYIAESFEVYFFAHMEAFYGFNELALHAVYSVFTAIEEYATSHPVVELFARTLVGEVEQSAWRYMLQVDALLKTSQAELDGGGKLTAVARLLYRPPLTPQNVESWADGITALGDGSPLTLDRFNQAICKQILSGKEVRVAHWRHTLASRGVSSNTSLRLLEFQNAMRDLVPESLRSVVTAYFNSTAARLDLPSRSGVPVGDLALVASFLECAASPAVQAAMRARTRGGAK